MSTFADRGVSRGQRGGSPTVVNLSFQDRVPDPLLLKKSSSAWNRTRDLWICSQELWPLSQNVYDKKQGFHSLNINLYRETNDVVRTFCAHLPNTPTRITNYVYVALCWTRILQLRFGRQSIDSRHTDTDTQTDSSALRGPWHHSSTTKLVSHTFTLKGEYNLEMSANLSSNIKQLNTKYVRFEVFTAVTMKNGVFWDVTPCGSCKNQRFERT
jgi:hypothetical protein